VIVGAVAGGVALAANASKDATVRASASSSFGMVLVNSAGHSLYRYTLDRKGVNACTGGCAQLWPPLLIKGSARPTVGGGANAGLIGTIAAPRGMRVVTYAGFPLHLFSGDTNAGQTKGQGFEGKWFLVDVKGALVKQAVKPNAGGAPGATTTAKSTWG
jgi:predicted lipoprotein with Yx(FWY)xxD motif